MLYMSIFIVVPAIGPIPHARGRLRSENENTKLQRARTCSRPEMASRVPTTARTVVVGNRSVNAAYRGLQRIMMGTGLAKQVRAHYMYYAVQSSSVRTCSCSGLVPSTR